MPDYRIRASWPIRKKLLLLILAVFLPVAAIIVASGLERREHEITTAKDNALLMVQSLAAQQEQIAIGTKQMLSTLAQLPEVQRLDAQACHRLFSDLLRQFPFYSTIGLATPDGNILASAMPLNSGSINISEQKHIKDALKTIDFSVGECIIGKVTKVPSIHYSYPVLDEDRNLRAIVIAGFNLSGYVPFIAKANLPEDSAVIITDHRGVRLYRFPENETAAVGTYIQKETIELISGDREQGIFETTGHDGIRRVYAFKQLRLRADSPPYVYMIAGIPKNKILHKADLKLLGSLLALGITALVALSFAWLFGNEALVKPINQLVAGAQRLGGGEAGTRTGLLHTGDELGHLAKSFDDMASRLDAKEEERKQVAQEVQNQKEILERVFESAPYIMMLVNKEGRVTKINRIGASFSGRLKEEILGLLGGEVLNCLNSFDGLGCGRNATCSDCAVRTGVMLTVQTEEGIHEAEGCLRVRRGSSDVDIDMLVSTALLKDRDSDIVLVTIADITERKRAEKALRESEERFRELAENIREVFWVRTPAEILYVSPAYEEIWGRSCESLYEDPASFIESIHPDDRERVLDAYVAGREHGKFDEEYRIVRLEGDFRWIWARSYPLSKDGHITHSVGIAEDITKRKITELALQESEERYRSFFENSMDGIMLSAPDGRVFAANQQACRMLGYTEKEICELGRAGLVDSIDERLPGPIEERTKAGAARGELNLVRKDGSKFPAEISSGVFKDRNGEKRTVLILRDISERKRAEEALRLSEEKFSLAFANNPAAIAITRLEDGRFLEVNNTWESLIGYSREEAIGHSAREMHIWPSAEASLRFADELREKGFLQGWQQEFLKRSGETFVTQLSSQVLAVGGEPVILSTLVDITEQKRAEEALRESEKGLRFLSSRLLSAQEEERKRIAGELHDGLGSSLSAIKISLENARRQLDEGRAAPDLMEIPIAWTQNLIDEARRLMSELRPSVLDDMGIVAAIGWFLRQYRETYHKIHVEEEIRIAEEDVPEPLKIVIFRITQEAFHNIAKYSRAEFASLSLVRSDGAIELAIEDSGEGFDLRAALSKISERKGLGLTSMKERCELSGGTFHMHSSIGEGTVIRASWPVG